MRIRSRTLSLSTIVHSKLPLQAGSMRLPFKKKPLFMKPQKTSPSPSEPYAMCPPFRSASLTCSSGNLFRIEPPTSFSCTTSPAIPITSHSAQPQTALHQQASTVYKTYARQRQSVKLSRFPLTSIVEPCSSSVWTFTSAGAAAAANSAFTAIPSHTEQPPNFSHLHRTTTGNVGYFGGRKRVASLFISQYRAPSQASSPASSSLSEHT